MTTTTEIKVRANQSKRTFTIVKEGSKYRTGRMSKEDFEENECNTIGDWANFLSKSQDYSIVTKN